MDGGGKQMLEAGESHLPPYRASPHPRKAQAASAGPFRQGVELQKLRDQGLEIG